MFQKPKKGNLKSRLSQPKWVHDRFSLTLKNAVLILLNIARTYNIYRNTGHFLLKLAQSERNEMTRLRTIKLNESVFSSMKKELGADGDFAYAYVIAHEVGHHVEYLLGTLQKVNRAMQGVSKTEANRLSVRLELLADYYAGVWANNDNRLFSSIEEGDIKEAIRCSEVIGDDYLQEKSYGRSMPDTFTHGTSEQRERWLALGLKYGDMTKYSPFNYSDEQL